MCLQKLDYVEVYTSLGWKKKYKAPTEHGFALKVSGGVTAGQRSGHKRSISICGHNGFL